MLNIEVTGPYGHDGAFSTLEGMVRHNLDPFQSFETYDTGQLSPGTQIIRMRENTQKALDKLAADREAGKSKLEIVELSDAEVQDLVEFLKTLTDPCVKDPACLAPWIPDETDPDPDGMRLRAVFADE